MTELVEQLPLFDETPEELVERLRDRRAPLMAKVQEIDRQIQAVYNACKCEKTKKTSWYSEGDYYNTGWTYYADKCVFCGKLHNKESVSDKCYG